MTAITIKYDETNKVFEHLLSVFQSLGASLSRTRKVKEDPTLMTKEEFYAKIDRAKEQVRQGKVISFNSAAEAKAYFDAKFEAKYGRR